MTSLLPFARIAARARNPTESATDHRQSTPARILVRQVNWLGDLVMTLPATRALRDAFPQAELTVLVKQELAAFYDGCSWLDEVMPFKVRKGVAGIRDQIRLVADLRRRKFDTAVIFPRSFSSALLVAMAGIPRRIGWADDARSVLLSTSLERSPELLQKHQVNDHLELVHQGLGVEPAATEATLAVSELHRESMLAWLQESRSRTGELVALAVAAAFGPAKEWPADSYAALIDRLAAEGVECVLIGAPGERERCEQIAAAADANPLVAAGRTSVGELIALLSLCDAFVGNDSGAMHVAAALGIPTVGIFGSTRAWRTGPMGPKTRVVQHSLECSPCMERRCRFGHYDCLRLVRVDEVARALNAAARESVA